MIHWSDREEPNHPIPQLHRRPVMPGRAVRTLATSCT